jgi:hypothetical protein
MKPKTKVMAIKYLVCSLSVAVLSGCTINMQHGQLHAPLMVRSGQVNVAASAIGSDKVPKGANGHVGWGRFTLFAIPVVPIHVEGDGNAAIAEEIQEALKQAGYTPQSVGYGASGKVLECQVDKFKFNNYTWLFPIVPTWGSIQLDLNLKGPNQNAVWNRQYSASGATLNFFDGYTDSCKSAMTKILNQMVTDFAAQDFYDALNK